MLADETREYVGSYQLLSKVGQGGMGTVYRARNSMTGEVVAVKLLLPHLTEESGRRSRLLREARVGMKVRHDNAVRILARGEHRGQSYIVMEYLSGSTLRDLIKELTRLLPGQALAVGIRIAEALQAIHDLGITHRDVKSDNFMMVPATDTASTDSVITGLGVPKLMGFSLARSNEAARLTHTGEILGTAPYMSPEQEQGKDVGPASDQYSLGVVLYECLVGQVPFFSSSIMQLLKNIVLEPVPSIAEQVPDLDEELERIVVRMLTRKPEDRFPTLGEAGKAMRQLLS